MACEGIKDPSKKKRCLQANEQLARLKAKEAKQKNNLKSALAAN